ncbi:MAG: OsmC family protein [Casimicrobiaceae bacterium]
MATKVVSHENLDMSKPIIRKKSVSVRNQATMKSVIDCGEFGTLVTDEPVAHGGTGEGPSPLQVVLGALCGCESVTFNRTAQEFGFGYAGIEFDAMFTIDVRGRMGVANVRPHFHTVSVQATVDTNESEERLAQVVEETERRCPVFNLLQDAKVNVEMLWVRRSGS